MSRDGSGNYTLPAGNPVVDGTVIDVDWANPTMADIAVQLNNVLTKDGVVGPSGAFKVVSGTYLLPGLSFNGHTNTGLWDDTLSAGWSFRGVAHLTSSASLLTANVPMAGSSLTLSSTLAVTGAITASGGVVGNVTGNCSGSAGSAATATTATSANALNGVSSAIDQAVQSGTVNALVGQDINGALYRYNIAALNSWLSGQTLSVNVTGSAGSVAWANVSGAPTAVSSFSNDSGYLTSGTVGSYAPSLTGTGASGTWSISISGNATTATSATSATSATTATTANALNTGNNYQMNALGVGTSNSTSGSIYATGNITAYSDIRFKINIRVIDNALDKVCSLRGITYNRLDLQGMPRHTGVIAQELRKVLPEAVVENEGGILSVAYGNVIGLLIEAIKELREEVRLLKRAV